MNTEIVDLNVGDTVPSFCLPDKDNRETCLTDFKGNWIVLYFYPKEGKNS
jgi:peroxiredoxin Q/BCP